MVKDARDVARSFVNGATSDKLGNIWIDGHKLYSNGKVIARRDICQIDCNNCTHENKFGCWGGNYADYFNRDGRLRPRKMLLIANFRVPEEDLSIRDKKVVSTIQNHILGITYVIDPDYFWGFYPGWLDNVPPNDQACLKMLGYRDSIFD